MSSSSLYALLYVSVPTMIVIRSLLTLSVAVLEYITLNDRISTISIGTLVAMLMSTVIYAKHDLTFNIPGYTWLLINIVGTSIYQVHIKKVIHSPLIANMGSVAMSYYNNLISLPLLLILVCITGELTKLSSPFNMIRTLKVGSIGVILVSCVLGFCSSVSSFKLNSFIFTTSIMIANNVHKLVTIILSEMIIQPTLNVTAFISAIFVLFFGCLYSQRAKLHSKTFLFLIPMVLSILSITLLFEYDNNISNGIVLKSWSKNIIERNGMKNYLSKQNDMIFLKTRNNEKEIYQLFLPRKPSSQTSRHIIPGMVLNNITEFRLPEICSNKNASIWKICDPKACTPSPESPQWTYPRTTNTGEKTSDFINRVLKIAWGENPPSIDLYLRSGCNGVMEMKYLFASIELFWPRFLGSIIVVLDVGDEAILKHILPSTPVHQYLIKFEHVPCMPGRVFNQYSYLNIDRHSTADYVVTIDSDCVFHSPVTPDLIFRQGRVILPSSRTFQGNMWVDSLTAMMEIGMYDGHYMVTQPVTFALSTFPAFRKWFYVFQRICYEDRLAQLDPKHYGAFCWMCQLGTYLERAYPIRNECQLYWYQHMDNSLLEPILRYSIHVTYEGYDSPDCQKYSCYEKTTNEVVKQGLCRAFGPSIFQFCSNYSEVAYINKVTFLYAYTEIQAANQTDRENALRNYLSRLSNVTALALNVRPK